MPRHSPPPWAPTCLAPPSRRQRSSSFPRPTRSHAHRCSRLMRQHGGEQSGLVTLTFDLLTLKVISESRVTWATSVPILVFLGLSVLDLGPMYATDRRQTSNVIQTSDVRQKHRLMPPPIRGGRIAMVKTCGQRKHRCLQYISLDDCKQQHSCLLSMQGVCPASQIKRGNSCAKL